MNKLKKLLKLIVSSSDMILHTIVFICGIWIAMIPLVLTVYVHVRAWHQTDPTLSNFERFNETIHYAFWETVLLCVLLFVLRKIVIWAINYYEKKERE